MNITDLNYDCLAKIFSYLDLESLIDVRDVCERFHVVANMNRNQHNKFTISHRNVQRVGKTIEFLGPNLSDLTVSFVNARYCNSILDVLKAIPDHCNNVKTLTIRFLMNEEYWANSNLRRIVKNISVLRLRWCFLYENVNDLFACSTNLETLIIGFPSYRYNFTQFKNLENLNVLKLVCAKINSRFELFQWLQENVKDLEVENTYEVEQDNKEREEGGEDYALSVHDEFEYEVD